jgi:hypothetical protein
MTLVSCWVLVLPSLFATPTLSTLDPDVRHAVRPIAGLLSKHYDTVQPPGSRWNWYKEVFWRLAVNGVRAAGACQRYFSAPCPCDVVGSGAFGDCERLRQHAFWECAIAQAVRTQVQCGLGGALLQQWHLWLVDPPPSVCQIKWSGGLWCWWLSGPWSRVGNACGLWFIRLLGRGLLCSRPFPKLPPPSGLPCMTLPGMIGQSQLTGMKSALIILSCLFASRFPCAHA